MDNDKLQEEVIVDDSHEHYNILNFHDFVLGESKKGKKDNKKSKPKVKNSEEYTDDMGDDFIDPNENSERYIKLREQFVKENYK